jgi:multidrug efflux system membrane fusion protein
MKKFFGIFLLLLCAAGATWRIDSLQQAKAAGLKAGKGTAASPVVVTPVDCRPMPVEIRTFGTVEALASVTVKPQISGLLSEIAFTEGQMVHEGDLLARIDTRPFEAALHQAEAALARTQAQRTKAERDLRRSTELFAKGFTSENERDQVATALAVQQASERSDAAAVESARIQLGYCTIRAPISGRTGRRLVDQGNLVVENATSLVTINKLQPLNVTFAIPQQDMARLRDWQGESGIRVAATLPENDGLAETGRLAFLDNAVDRATGMLTLKAEFPNASSRLWPGQFVNVRMSIATETNALVIPFRAVQNGQKGTYVFVVKPDHTVEARPVKIARNAEEDSIIAEGLKAGETVVTDGQQRLGPGSKVEVTGKPAAPPAGLPAP